MSNLISFLLLFLITLVISDNVTSLRKLSYPARIVYIDRIKDWTNQYSIAAGMGVPGYSKQTLYNYVLLAFWKYNGPTDLAKVWNSPLTYFGKSSQFGTTNKDIRTNLKKKYNDAGIKLLISAFGSGYTPTTDQLDPQAVATKLAAFVVNTDADGVDINYEDNIAMKAGTGEAWLIKLMKRLRFYLPDHIITNTVQAPYFCKSLYVNGAYQTINTEVGDLIDIYIVQYYNQGNSQYTTYESLFLSSDGYAVGTSVQQLINKNITSKKIVVGKPVSSTDVANTGFVNSTDLGDWVKKAYNQLGWYGGIMLWQFINDKDGNVINTTALKLIQLCNQHQTCI